MVEKSYSKHVTITKTVPVNNIATLADWLNIELSEWLQDKRDGGANRSTAGSKALDLIKDAGFTITPPTVSR